MASPELPVYAGFEETAEYASLVCTNEVGSSCGVDPALTSKGIGNWEADNTPALYLGVLLNERVTKFVAVRLGS